MLRQIIVDASILIALIDQRDRYHAWAREQLGAISPPLITCEAVISEAWFLLKRVRNGREALLLLLERDQVSVEFDLTRRASVGDRSDEALSVSSSICRRCGTRQNGGAASQ
jgi:predicted nucleic acid-binding protein